MNKGWNNKWVYALYKGEECLAIGTKEQISKELGIKKETLDYYGTKTYLKEIESRKNTIEDGYRTLIKIGKENDEI